MSHTIALNPPISINLNLGFAVKIFWISAVISIISLAVLYVFQINALTGENYLITNQEQRLSELRKETEILKINFAKANSLVNIDNYFQNKSFVKINEVKYIQIPGSSVAELPN